MKNKNKLTRFFATLRMTSKRAAFTLTEVAEAGQYGSKHELSAVAKVEPEARQYAPSPLEGEGWGEGFRKRAAFTLAEVPEARQYRSKQAAFTLAEVLITLGIIGVVAALTIPALMKVYDKKITVTKLKQTYSMLAQAVKLSTIDNGDIAQWEMPATEFGASSYEVSRIFFNIYLAPYLKVSEICQVNSNKCWANKYSFLNGLDYSYMNASSNYGYSVILSNGVSLGIWTRGSFTEVYVDLNGKNKPNIKGKDVFSLIIFKATSPSDIIKADNQGVYFYGHGYNRKQLIDINNNNLKDMTCNDLDGIRYAGSFCGALIMHDGWEIKDDYPW